MNVIGVFLLSQAFVPPLAQSPNKRAIMSFVKQYLQLGIIVLLLLAVFGVLLTPDTNDDPAGVMVRPEKGRLLVAPVLITQVVSLPPLAATTPILFSLTHVSTSVAKLDLICSRLC